MGDKSPKNKEKKKKKQNDNQGKKKGNAAPLTSIIPSSPDKKKG